MQTAQLMQMLAGALIGTVTLLSVVWPKTWQQLLSASLSTTLKRHRAAHQTQAFVLMSASPSKSLSHKDEFFTFWAPLAHHVKAHEPGTLAFELLQPDTEPAELLVYERYTDKEYYLKVDRTSAPMATFKQCLAAAGWQVQISGQSYNELNIGFMQ